MNKHDFELHVKEMLAERAESLLHDTPGYKPLKIYGLYRTDLEMDEHKLASQLGHAYVKAWNVACKARPELETEGLYMGHGSGNGTKVVMFCKNQGQLLRAYREALAAGFPCCLVIDTRHVQLPHFTGQPVITAVGIGPVYEDEVHDITKRFRMVRAVPPKAPEPAEVSS